MPKVSVIIPVFNTAAYLESSIGSIREQTLEDIEIICVNDGSADDSLQILERLAREDCRIRIIDQINSGQSAARNAALRQAIGEYIYFMDSDDLVTPRMLEELCTVCDRENLDVLFFAGTSFYESEQLEKRQQSLAMPMRYTRTGAYPPCMTGPELFRKLRENKEYYVSPCLQLIRREFLEKRAIAFYDGIIHEDNLFTFQVILSADRASCVPNVFFRRRIREKSVVTSKENHKNLRGYFVCMLKMAQFAGTLDIVDQETIDAVDSAVSKMNHHVHRIYAAIGEEEKALFLSKCTPFERCVFCGITRWDIKEVRRAEAKGKKELRKAKEKVRKIRKSVSFRLGHAIVAPALLAITACRSLKKGQHDMNSGLEDG